MFNQNYVSKRGGFICVSVMIIIIVVPIIINYYKISIRDNLK